MSPNSSQLVDGQHRNFYCTVSSREEADEVEVARIRPDLVSLCDPFLKLCFNIALYLTNVKTGKANIRCKHGRKMEELTKDLLRKHGMVYSGITQRLKLNEHNIVGSFEAVADETFSDGCNFGRIVATYALFVVMLDYCLLHGLEDKVEELQEATVRVIAKQKAWITNNGGWVRACLMN